VAEPFSGSLDPVETKSICATALPQGSSQDALRSDTAFRHSGWQHDRANIRLALERVEVSEARLCRWDTCGSHAWVVRHPTDRGRLKIMASFCHDRFCKPCATHRSRLIVANLRRYLTTRQYRFITLTLWSTDHPLKELVDKLYASFRKLRATKLWKRSIGGGAAFLEIKWSEQKQRWHPHLHIICQGMYIESGFLSQEWLRITGDSSIVDVRSAGDLDRVTSYVAKYASKPLSNTFLNRPNQLDEAIRALTGRRLVCTFGVWRGWPLLACTDDTEWEPVAPLQEVREKAAQGSPWARAILNYLWRKRPCTTPNAQTRAPPPDDPPLR